MRNHTATHLLNACLKKIKGVTCQKSSKVTDGNLSFDVALFGDKLGPKEIVAIENEIRRIIEIDRPVLINEVDSQKLLDFDWITLVPGETYPESGIRVVEIQADDFVSRFVECIENLQVFSDELFSKFVLHDPYMDRFLQEHII